jgi:osmotically-inducible protein OsmY
MKPQWLFSLCGAALLLAACSQSDAGITATVKSRLVGDDQIKAGQIDVDTNNRVVTLSGRVRTSQEESHAVELAQETKGVTQVINHLTVAPEDIAPTTGFEQGAPGTLSDTTKEGIQKSKEGAQKVGEKTKEGLSKTGEVITDVWITTRIKSRFVGEDLLKDSDINVDTDNHVVMLKGTVMSAAGRARAVELAKTTEGVNQVRDQLTIGPKATKPSATPGKPRY